MNILEVLYTVSYFKMFPQIFQGTFLKYDTVGNIYKLLGDFAEHFISLKYDIIL